MNKAHDRLLGVVAVAPLRHSPLRHSPPRHSPLRCSRFAHNFIPRSALFLGLGLLNGACCSDLPEARVAGTVVDAETLEPLTDVTLTWNGQTTTTGSDGAYAFSMPIGAHEVNVSRRGTSFSTLLVVAYTKWMEAAAQTQDVLVPAGESPPAGFTLNLLGPDFKDAASDMGSGLITTNRDGGEGRLLPVSDSPARFPQWAGAGQLLYFADFDAPGHVFRHDVAKRQTQAIDCEGFEPFNVEMFCVSPDGDVALATSNGQTTVLRGLNGRCNAETVGGAFVPAYPPSCAFDAAGKAYVAVKRQGGSNDAGGQLRVVDTSADKPTTEVVAWVSDWNFTSPRVLPDRQLLIERVLEVDDRAQRETWSLDFIAETSTRLSETPAPVDLLDGRLYYIAQERALRVRVLDSGKEATLVNGAVFATPTSR